MHSVFDSGVRSCLSNISESFSSNRICSSIDTYLHFNEAPKIIHDVTVAINYTILNITTSIITNVWSEWRYFATVIRKLHYIWESTATLDHLLLLANNTLFAIIGYHGAIALEPAGHRTHLNTSKSTNNLY